MTTEKIPYVVRLQMNPRWKSVEEVVCDGTVYYRAKPVRELLKSIRDQVEFCKKHDSTPALDKTMELIDNFLGG